MSKKPPIQPQDKYVLRLPDGLRDRIKAYAERHGRSMNAEIIRILEREYPEPWPIDARVDELIELLKVLKGGATDERIDRLINEIEETVFGMITGRVRGVNDSALNKIEERWGNYQIEKAKYDPVIWDLDEDELRQHSISGRTDKFVPPAPERKTLKNYTDEELEIFKAGYERGVQEREGSELLKKLTQTEGKDDI